MTRVTKNSPKSLIFRGSKSSSRDAEHRKETQTVLLLLEAVYSPYTVFGIALELVVEAKLVLV